MQIDRIERGQHVMKCMYPLHVGNDVCKSCGITTGFVMRYGQHHMQAV